MNGKRKGCSICHENSGLIKYSACCGEPFHVICFSDLKLEDCIMCDQKGNFKLTSDVKFPHKAFIEE